MTTAPNQQQQLVDAHWPIATSILTLAIVIVYIWQGMTVGHYGEFSADELMALGANVPPLTLSSEPWRLATAIFLHASIDHLLSNAVTLLLLGGALELIVSRWKWLLIFGLGGLASSFATASLNFDYVQHNLLLGDVHRLFVSAGASGAIMSLGGAVIMLGIYRTLAAERGMDPMLRAGLAFVGLNLVYGLTTGGIDNTAHFSGLFFGCLCGAAVLTPPHLPLRFRLGTAAVCSVIFALGLASFKGAQPVGNKRTRLVAEVQEMIATTQHKQAMQDALQAESAEQLSYVDEAQATGQTIAVNGIARVVPGAAANTVYLATNGDSARIVEYDLTRGQIVRTIIDKTYPTGKLWGCKTASCAGIGIADLVLNADATTAYAAALQPGKVSRIDMTTGHIDYSTTTGAFPSRLLLANGRVYAYDRIDNTVSIINAGDGELLRQIDIPSRRNEENSIGGYAWSGGKNMALTTDGSALYLYTPDGRIVQLDLSNFQTDIVNMHDAQGLAKGARGRVWLYAPAAVYNADVLDQAAYDYGVRKKSRKTIFVNADGKHPLMLAWHETYGNQGRIVGISPLSGHARRSWRSDTSHYDWGALEQLDAGRFVIRGWHKAEIFAITRSMQPDSRDQAIAADVVVRR